MSYHRFRPRSHFQAPHSWSNDPCGAVYVPEIKEYIICYQWNPGTTDGGNSAWGMARSKDLVTWRDCLPAIQNGPTYDALGVFSGSIVSRLIDGERVLFLFYTSVSALPIHWSKPYLKGCESQSVAVSKDFGETWSRFEGNPLLDVPPHADATTGWRDPFVSRWSSLSTLLGLNQETAYMMLASGKREHGPQLQLYRSDNFSDWSHVSTILDAKMDSEISEASSHRFGKNFECASFFSIGQLDYILVGVEEDEFSQRHRSHLTLWLAGQLKLDDTGKPRFETLGHGLLDHGISYAPHIFRDAQDRLLQLGWADEAAKDQVIKAQGWAGTLVHPRELIQVIRPHLPDDLTNDHEWTLDSSTGLYTTLGIRPAHQVEALRGQQVASSLTEFKDIQSTNFEVQASFNNLTGKEKLVLNVRQAPDSAEVTKLVFNLEQRRIEVDRSHSSLAGLGASTPDVGHFQLLPGEDLQFRIFVDNSVLEVYANDRFALTSRVYPSLDSAVGASYDFGSLPLENIKFQCWIDLRDAWPRRSPSVLTNDVGFPRPEMMKRKEFQGEEVLIMS
ncbi:hypothetical protein S40288_09189 [Stachybotrys chartarum IBT 40288]|nr:hypothetical protein S40288_09189 [Stachybotrys chartarum IBT 40288]